MFCSSVLTENKLTYTLERFWIVSFLKNSTCVSETAQQVIHSIPEWGVQNKWFICTLKVLISSPHLSVKGAYSSGVRLRQEI